MQRTRHRFFAWILPGIRFVCQANTHTHTEWYDVCVCVCFAHFKGFSRSFWGRNRAEFFLSSSSSSHSPSLSRESESKMCIFSKFTCFIYCVCAEFHCILIMQFSMSEMNYKPPLQWPPLATSLASPHVLIDSQSSAVCNNPTCLTPRAVTPTCTHRWPGYPLACLRPCPFWPFLPIVLHILIAARFVARPQNNKQDKGVTGDVNSSSN